MNSNEIIYLIQMDNDEYAWCDSADPDPYVDSSDVTQYIRVDKLNNLIAAAEEMLDLMEDVRTGNYVPDSFTTQPLRIALNYIKQKE